MTEGAYSHEVLTHFRCMQCMRWWTIADVPPERLAQPWHCPWCGMVQESRQIETPQA